MSELPQAQIEQCFYSVCPKCDFRTHYYFASIKGMPGSNIKCKNCGEWYILK